MPARDEAPTVAANVAAAAACRYVREVIVVDDGSTDGTGDIAAAAGAKVIAIETRRVEGPRDGARASTRPTPSAFLFVDADCTGLTAAHLDAICEPFLDGRAVCRSVRSTTAGSGTRWCCGWPPLAANASSPDGCGTRSRRTSSIGYTIEVRINEVIAERRLRTVVRTMPGVYHRTKRVKLGRRAGLRSTWAMYRELLRIVWPIGDVRLRTYWFYLRGLSVER